MRAFRDFSRQHHLTWTRVHYDNLPEDAAENNFRKHGSLEWPHLQNIPQEKSEGLAAHVLNDEEREHYEKQHEKIRRSPAYFHQHSYKYMSDVYNVPLRDAKRSGGGLILKVHHYPDDHAARAYMNDLGAEHSRHIDKIHGMEGVTDRPTHSDMTVWRGIHTMSGMHKQAPGRIFTDQGFTGTSFSPGYAIGFAGNHDPDDVTVPEKLRERKVIAKVHVPAGARGHFLDIDPHTPHRENEFLLHRGTQFRINGHSLAEVENPRLKNNYVPLHIVHMSVIGNHPKELINPYQKRQTFVQGARLSGRLSTPAVPEKKTNFDDDELHKKLKAIEF